MTFDLDEGLYVFETTLGYIVGDTEQMTVPFILTADDAEEAEELVLEYLESLQLADRFWLVEIVGPFDSEEYHTQASEGEREQWDRLDDHSEEDFLEILHSEDL
jgi:hypothetical protein